MPPQSEQILSTPGKTPLSKAERASLRRERQRKAKKVTKTDTSRRTKTDERNSKAVDFLTKNEGMLLDFVVKVDKLYKETLNKPAPFMTFVLVGMQSSGKSTFMERLLNAVLNIVQEGTGTRCPLNVTCICDKNCKSPRADLSGEELEQEGKDLSVDEVFKMITSHNKSLADQDRLSTKDLTLVYRANNVQNMRFVDTPGIITNRSTGKDNRSDIKGILKAEMAQPNTRLCVLLEATEYSKNPIIDFLDESLDGRKEWIGNATFLMTKFDKHVEDSRTASRANSFFAEFMENSIVPHLVITPTLPVENLPDAELFQARNELLANSNDFERGMFHNWFKKHEEYRQNDASDEYLNEAVKQRVGSPPRKLP